MWRTWSRRAWATAGCAALVLAILLGWAVSRGGGGAVAPDGASRTGDTGSILPAAPPTAQVAPQVAARRVRAAADLDAVCANSYFPAAPRWRGRAPHPVVISVRDRRDLAQRSARTLNPLAYGSSAAARRAWAPAATKAQIVACLDLIGGGATLRNCRTDEPKRPTLPLEVGRYRLTVYEIATRRKVAETTLEGAERSCPWVVLTGSDPTLYTAVSDRQLVRALRRPVTQPVSESVQPRKRQ
ncbi:hypothetical protein [Actinoplanes teichomyceticus]|nr:hypothetical protein [Actinoplanes teichomyceticus]